VRAKLLRVSQQPTRTPGCQIGKSPGRAFVVVGIVWKTEMEGLWPRPSPFGKEGHCQRQPRDHPNQWAIACQGDGVNGFIRPGKAGPRLKRRQHDHMARPSVLMPRRSGARMAGWEAVKQGG